MTISNFTAFCKKIDDKYKVELEEDFVFKFTNSSGDVFNVNPCEVKDFIRFFIENYSSIENTWEKVPSRKKFIDQWEEKSYRAIYKYAEDNGAKGLAGLAKSQTKGLTSLISKVVAFLVGEDEFSITNTTYFGISSFKLADENWSLLFKKNSKPVEPNVLQDFKEWLLNKGLSEKTAKDYSGYCIKKANEIVISNGYLSHDIYKLSSNDLSSVLEALEESQEWISLNKDGNRSYCIGLKHFIKYKEYKQKIKGDAVPLSKPFILLAGISGTGKTRFVRKQAAKTGRLDETYCLTSVRPDWHEPSDLLGYISRLDGRPQFIVTDVLYFIVQAWREILSAGVRLEKTVNDRFVVSGEKAHLEQVRPYWLCLDEMNLAPVEQYFADYLSTLETREWAWSGESFSYSSDPLLKSATMAQLGENSTLREDLGLQSVNYDMAWEMFYQHGIGIPFNLIVAGTVNMDETTHGFSRKVIDRALSFDFGAFFPNNFDDFFVPTVCNKVLSYPLQSQAGQLDLKSTYDSDGQKSIAFLEAINKILKGTPFELAYRALNELLLAVTCAQPQDDKCLIAVWDDFIMCKVLPRIEGDNDKLTTAEGDAILIKLNVVLQDQLAPIFDESHNDVMQRPDLYRERIITDSNNEKTLNIPCRSIRKLEWMQQRLVSATFTSFWP